MGSIEVVVGVVIIIASLVFGWAARPSAAGIARRIQSHRTMEPYFPILIMALIVIGIGLIMIGFGVQIGQEPS